MAERGSVDPVALFVPDATAAEFGDLARVPRRRVGCRRRFVGDLGGAWTFDAMNRAFRLLTLTHPPVLVALGMARFWKDADGLTLDDGPFVQALAYASGIEPLVTGKPAPAFFHSAAHHLGLAPEAVVMVGDDIRSDIGGAQDAGLCGVLVQTGKFHAADLAQGITPDAVLASIADVPGWMQSTR